MPIAFHHRDRFYRRQGNGKERSASLDIPPPLPPTQSRISIALARPDSASISGSASSIHTLATTARTSTVGAASTLNTSSGMYRMPGASPAPSAITPPDHNDLSAPYLNLVDFPSTTTLTLNSALVPDERPRSHPPRPTSMTPQSSSPPPPPPPRSQPKARQSLTSLSSFSLSNMRRHSHSHSYSQSTAASNSGSDSTASTTTSAHKSPQNPTPSTQKPPKKQKLPLPTLHPAAPPSPATDLLTLTRHIETQTSQARHLFSLKHALLDPTEQSWISATIRDTEVATREVAVLTEGLRVEQVINQGRLGVKTQLKWMLRDSKRAREKRERLVVVHQSLMTVLGRLQGVQGVPVETGIGAAVASGMSTGTESGRSGTDREEDTRDNAGFKLASEEKTRRRRRMTVDKAQTISPASMKQVPEEGPWDLSVQLQDAGMEAVVPNMVAEKVGISVTAKQAQEVGSPPSTKMDNELMDMLSWRWAQGRATG